MKNIFHLRSSYKNISAKNNWLRCRHWLDLVSPRDIFRYSKSVPQYCTLPHRESILPFPTPVNCYLNFSRKQYLGAYSRKVTIYHSFVILLSAVEYDICAPLWIGLNLQIVCDHLKCIYKLKENSNQSTLKNVSWLHSLKEFKCFGYRMIIRLSEF